MNAIELILNKIARVLLYRIDTPISNKWYVSLVYRRAFNKWPNLRDPHTFNEKINWMKLYDHNQIYPILVDKARVKEYVAEKIGDQYVIPTIGLWDDSREIDFGTLPDQFVLKCNHDSGSVIICRDKSQFDKEGARRELRKHLKKNLYYAGREWAYRDVKPMILAEPLLSDHGEHPKDYKVYCFNGEPQYIVVFYHRFDGGAHVEGVYDTSWKKQGFSFDAHWGIADLEESKPGQLSDMLKCAKILSEGMMQSRIDFYIVNEKVYFGEITLYTAGGTVGTVPNEMDLELGKMIHVHRYKVQG